MKISVTNDKELVAKIRQAIKENEGHCPCMPKKTPETKCMCKAFLELAEGTCICGLYIKTLQ